MLKISADNVNYQQLDCVRSTLWVEDESGSMTGGVRVPSESVAVVCPISDARTWRSQPTHQLALQSVLVPEGFFSGCSYS